jgi:hypothetical protein
MPKISSMEANQAIHQITILQAQPVQQGETERPIQFLLIWKRTYYRVSREIVVHS